MVVLVLEVVLQYFLSVLVQPAFVVLIVLLVLRYFQEERLVLLVLQRQTFLLLLVEELMQDHPLLVTHGSLVATVVVGLGDRLGDHQNQRSDHKETRLGCLPCVLPAFHLTLHLWVFLVQTPAFDLFADP